MSDTKITVTRGQGPFINSRDALRSLDLSTIKGKSILVKPNIGRHIGPGRGVNTHPDAIAGVIEVLQEAGASRITIGESPILGVNTLEAFDHAGVTHVANEYGVDLVDMDSMPPVEKEVPGGRILDKTRICAPVFEHDIIVSVPVAKCHMHTVVTLGIKNLKGCLYRREKVRYHQLEYREGESCDDKGLDSAISDLASILMPTITVVDGYIGMEGLGPSGGEPKVANFAVASFDALGADIVAARLMGYNAADVPHLRIIAERMGKPIDHTQYSVSPENWIDFETPFALPPTDISIEYPDVVLCDRESCSACLSTVMLFLKRFKSDMGQYVLDDGQMHLAIGKGVGKENVEDGTVIIGNCARKAADLRHICSGLSACPQQDLRGHYR
jgi:uncharacterized protein (DUF362 family)